MPCPSANTCMPVPGCDPTTASPLAVTPVPSNSPACGCGQAIPMCRTHSRGVIVPGAPKRLARQRNVGAHGGPARSILQLRLKHAVAQAQAPHFNVPKGRAGSGASRQQGSDCSSIANTCLHWQMGACAGDVVACYASCTCTGAPQPCSSVRIYGMGLTALRVCSSPRSQRAEHHEQCYRSQDLQRLHRPCARSAVIDRVDSSARAC